MVKINHKSKRVPAKRRYKIEKRIRDHARKVRKEAKKADNKKSKKKKTITIPNKFPLKEEILAEAEKQKEIALEEKKKKKFDRRKQNKQKQNFNESLNKDNKK